MVQDLSERQPSRELLKTAKLDRITYLLTELKWEILRGVRDDIIEPEITFLHDLPCDNPKKSLHIRFHCFETTMMTPPILSVVPRDD